MEQDAQRALWDRRGNTRTHCSNCGGRNYCTVCGTSCAAILEGLLYEEEWGQPPLGEDAEDATGLSPWPIVHDPQGHRMVRDYLDHHQVER